MWLVTAWPPEQRPKEASCSKNAPMLHSVLCCFYTKYYACGKYNAALKTKEITIIQQLTDSTVSNWVELSCAHVCLCVFMYF